MAEMESILTTDRKLVVSMPDKRTNVCVGIDTYSIVVKGADTKERFAFIDMWILPGGGPIPHAHECEEMFYVMEGEVTVFCDGERTRATTGSAVSIPGWAPHAFRNLSAEPARLFCVVAGAGLERQFLEIGPRVATRTSPPPPVDAEKKAELMKAIPKIAEKYNGRVLPPDTFDHLMTAEERKLVADANGD